MKFPQPFIDVFVLIAIFGFFAFMIWKKMLESESPLAIKILNYIKEQKEKPKDMKESIEQIYHEKREIM